MKYQRSYGTALKKLRFSAERHGRGWWRKHEIRLDQKVGPLGLRVEYHQASLGVLAALNNLAKLLDQKLSDGDQPASAMRTILFPPSSSIRLLAQAQPASSP